MEKIRIDSIIFDIDGTLWDSRQLVAEAWNEALSGQTEYRPDITPEALKRLFGKPMPEIFAGILPNLSEAEYRRISEICCKAEEEALKKRGGVLYDGVSELVPKLSARYPLYIVSNCQCGYIEEFLRHAGLRDYFRGWLCYGDTTAEKSVTMRKLTEAYQLKSPVYVGDIMGDARACREAGVPFVFAAYGFGEVPEGWYLKKIDAFSELSELLM